MVEMIRTASPAAELTIQGSVVTADRPDYDDARRVWNAAFDVRPSIVAQCLSASDVAASIGFAREHDLELAVRGGGHSISGLSTTEGGLVIDLSRMNGVQVDPGTRRARVQVAHCSANSMPPRKRTVWQRRRAR
jgi:FAD/FMN-containing dehydrogenase